MKPEDLPPDTHIISQPLLTEEGVLNPACMNELSATLAAMPPDYKRLESNDEWSSSKDQWTSKADIIGAFAMWACRQSPYGVPDGLENVCKYLNAALNSCSTWATAGMSEVSLCEINKWLHEILMDQGVTEFDNWNKCRKGSTPDVVFTSRFDGRRDPDRDFIDLHALLRNVCVTIRDERRKHKAFNDDFDKRHAKS